MAETWVQNAERNWRSVLARAIREGNKGDEAYAKKILIGLGADPEPKPGQQSLFEETTSV